jgi:effector-binding domain-containing protein
MKTSVKSITIIACIIILVSITYFMFYYFSMKDIKIPHYAVIKKEGAIELRRYQPMIVAQIEVKGARNVAINKGFKLLADYIFGNNLAMNTAITQKVQSEKIAMTAPVMQQQSTKNIWQVRFVMPAHYTLKDLPIPNDPEIQIAQKQEQRLLAISFSGRWSQKVMDSALSNLKRYIKKNNLAVKGKPIYAFYNPPWTLPFMRHNEIIYLVMTKNPAQ